MLKRTPLGERFLYPVTDKELERRWKAVRKAMKVSDVEVLIIQNEKQDLGGYVRWFCDVPAGYPETILFPIDEEMILINSGSPSRPIPPTFMRRGVKEVIAHPYFRTVNFTNEYDADIVIQKLKELGKKRIGLVNLGRMHACFYNKLAKELPDYYFIDFTDQIDYIKAIKSPEEIEAIQAAVNLHDYVMAAVPTIIRPGVRESDIRNEVHNLALQLGAEGEMFIMIGSNTIGTPCGQFPLLYAGRRIEESDYLSILLESSGPGGFFCELARTFCLGEPTPELYDCWEKAVQAQKICADMLVPGGDPQEVFNALNDYLSANGFEKEERLFAHGQGYDLIERPALMPGESMKFEENMYITLHPTTANQHAMCLCADNFLVTADGGKRLHKTQHELVIL